ncbi:MAG TPA: HmuY family protein [Flavobacterium sp.]|jgi:hypothetical protein
MKKNVFLVLSFVLLTLHACNEDDPATVSNSVAFSVSSINLTDNETPVQILFAEPTRASGTISLTYDATDVAYGTDFTTSPAAEDNTIVVPFEANVSSVTFTFNKIVNAIEGEVKNVVFTISDVSFDATIAGNATVQLNFNETASLGAALAPEVGGPIQPNQVYVDLSSGSLVAVPRISWDIGFSGAESRVVINSSVKMSVKQLATTNIDEVQSPDDTMIITQGQGIASQIDHPSGVLSGTAIAEVSANDSDNKVYLVNMGSGPSSVTPAVGAEGSASGESRGWKKIRVLKSGNNYILQYADIAATTHQQVTISTNEAYNFTFFSLTTNSVVPVEPPKNLWDLNFTTFTNLVGPTTPYYFPDYVLTNLKGGAKAYMVTVSPSENYDTFVLASVIDANFTSDQRNIGSNWRSTSVIGPGGVPISQFVLNTQRFFIIKDPAGNIYKLRFTGGANSAGERGFPTFQYSKL